MSELYNLTEQYTPVHQLNVYQGTSNYYIELHPVVVNGGKLTVGAGVPLTKKALRNLLAQVTKGEAMDIGCKTKLMPESILYFSGNKNKRNIIWFNAPQKRTISTNKGNIHFQCPGIIYQLSDDQLKVFTYLTKSRPSADTVLYRLPLPNIYEDGDVCMGNVVIPKDSSEISVLIERWEGCFWNSKFTNYLIDEDKQNPILVHLKKNKTFTRKHFTKIYNKLIKLL